ncbi:MAG TPA: ATP-binding protein [Anaerolineaceae bacterium]|nr:ATP-binding protein [Anaerolineaceae bacterium]
MTAFIDLIKNKNLSFLEIESLLNLFNQPCVLSDEDNEIALVNSALIELTAFTKQELIRTPLRSLITEERAENGKVVYRILRKNRMPLEVELSREYLDDKHHWKVYLINQKMQGDVIDYKALKSYLTTMSALIDARDETDASFYEKSLDILDKVFHFDLLCFYVEENGVFQLSDLSKKTPPHFPEKILVNELENIDQYNLWQQGNRAINHLHRSAREQFINVLVTQRFKKDHDQEGLIVAGWKEGVRDSSMLAIVEEYMKMVEHGASLFNQNTIHEQIRSESAKAQEILSYTLENIEEGVIVLDYEMKVLEINQNMERLLGYSKWEVQGLFVDSYLVADPKITTLFHDVFERQKEQCENGVSLRQRDGDAEPVKMRVIPRDVRDPQTQFLTLVRSTRELDGLKRNLKELEHQAALGKSVATFAHEVRNPINNMVTGLQVLQSMSEENEAQSDLITRMMNDCVRLDHLMNSILSYAKPLENKLKPLNLDLLVKSTIEKWEAKLTRNDVKMIYQCEEEAPVVMGDMRALEQVFTNLISNAVEAMKPQNGGTLAIKIEKSQAKTLTVTVSDTGPGIPDEILKNLFTPFVSFSLQGTGLGLAIIKEIIAAHNGEITVDSFPGGTVFSIALPIAEGE